MSCTKNGNITKTEVVERMKIVKKKQKNKPIKFTKHTKINKYSYNAAYYMLDYDSSAELDELIYKNFCGLSEPGKYDRFKIPKGLKFEQCFDFAVKPILIGRMTQSYQHDEEILSVSTFKSFFELLEDLKTGYDASNPRHSYLYSELVKLQDPMQEHCDTSACNYRIVVLDASHTLFESFDTDFFDVHYIDSLDELYSEPIRELYDELNLVFIPDERTYFEDSFDFIRIHIAKEDICPRFMTFIRKSNVSNLIGRAIHVWYNCELYCKNKATTSYVYFYELDADDIKDHVAAEMLKRLNDAYTDFVGPARKCHRHASMKNFMLRRPSSKPKSTQK